MEYYIDDFQNYLEQLCIAHKLVAHTVGGKRTFCRFQLDEEMEELRLHAGPNLVIVGDWHGRAAGSLDAAQMRQFTLIRFACYAANTGADAVNAAIARAWQIMWDFIAKMRQDAKADADLCGALEGAELQNISWDPFEGPIIEQHFGWDLTLPFISFQPPFNAAAWQ